MTKAIPETHLELYKPRMLLICIAHNENLVRLASILSLNATKCKEFKLFNIYQCNLEIIAVVFSILD